MLRDVIPRTELAAFQSLLPKKRRSKLLVAAVAPSDIAEVIEFARQAMTPTVLPWATATFEFHAKCLTAGIDDGRKLYKLVDSGLGIVGVCGTHRYAWGPPTNCWASWFIVHPKLRTQGVLHCLVATLFTKARESNFKKLFVETYSADPNYSRVSTVLEKIGFVHEARVTSYFADDVDMVIYSIDLSISHLALNSRRFSVKHP